MKLSVSTIESRDWLDSWKEIFEKNKGAINRQKSDAIKGCCYTLSEVPTESLTHYALKLLSALMLEKRFRIFTEELKKEYRRWATIHRSIVFEAMMPDLGIRADVYGRLLYRGSFESSIGVVVEVDCSTIGVPNTLRDRLRHRSKIADVVIYVIPERKLTAYRKNILRTLVDEIWTDEMLIKEVMQVLF
mgnify:CR=1 FL=1